MPGQVGGPSPRRQKKETREPKVAGLTPPATTRVGGRHSTRWEPGQ